MTQSHESGRKSNVLDIGQDAPFEMANLFPKHTGLPFVVWISVKGGAQHDVRVKVSQSPKALPSDMISVAIRPDVHLIEGKLSSRDLALLTRWIELNKETLIRYWESEMDTLDALSAIKQVQS